MAITPQPNVSVADFNPSDITLVPYTSFQFDSLLAGAVPETVASALRDLRPYSVFIRSGSSKAIIAYTVSWSSVDKMGQPYTHYGTVCDAISLKGLILPYTDGLVTIIGYLPSASLATDPQVFSDISEHADRFRDQASVRITLEAVMFEDG